MWRNEGFFKETKLELNLEKKNIPENCLLYINQSYILTVKNGDLAMYNYNFIIGQIIVAANQPSQIDQYVCKDNEVKLFTCLYDIQTGEFLSLKSEIAFIVLIGDERVFLYLTGLIVKKPLFYVLVQNKKYVTHSFLLHSENTTARL